MPQKLVNDCFMSDLVFQASGDNEMYVNVLLYNNLALIKPVR